MPTLSFNCPKCDKLHSRIKPEMSGHKVRCQCGFVFRLGPKEDKQPGVVEDLKRRRALKDRKKVTRQNAFDLQPAQVREWDADSEVDADNLVAASEPQLSDPLSKDEEPASAKSDLDDLFEMPDAAALGDDLELLMDDDLPNDLPDDLQVELADDPPVSSKAGPKQRFKPFEEEEILDAIPIASAPVSVGPAALAQATFAEPADPLGPLLDEFPVGQPLQRTAPLPVAAPKRKPKRKTRKRRSNAERLESPGGPIASLGCAFVAIPTAMFFGFILAFSFTVVLAGGRDATISGSLVTMVFNGFSTLFWFLFFVAACCSGVVAIIELSQKRRIKWANRALGISGSLLVTTQIVNFLYTLFSLPAAYEAASRFNPDLAQDPDGVGGIIGIVFGVFVAMGIVPLAAAIKGFVRSS